MVEGGVLAVLVNSSPALYIIPSPPPHNPLYSTLSAETLNLVERLLSVDPSKRLAAKEALDTPYFTVETPAACLPQEFVT